MKVFLALLVLVLPAAGLAQSPSCAELRAQLANERPVTALRRLSGAACLGDDRDEDPYTRRAQQLFNTAAKIEGQARARIRDVTLSPEENRALTLAVLRIADEYLSSVAGPEATQLRSSVQQAIRDESEGIDSGAPRPRL